MYDVLVIGVGPAGSTAARLLAKAGWSVAVVEKSRFPRRKVCGEFISATSLPLLYDRDIGAQFFSQAGPEVRRVGLFALGTALTSGMPPAANSVAGWGRALGRDQLDLLLAEAAAKAGAELWQPWKLMGLRRVSGGHVCTMAGEGCTKELHVRVVVAATGSWEPGPLLAEFAQTRRGSDLLAFKAHFRGGDLPQDLMPLLAFPGGYGGMVHTDRGRVSLSCCIRRDILQHCRNEHPNRHAGNSVLHHIQDHCEGVRETLEHACLDGTWLAAGPIRPGIRRRYADGIFFIGNIAGEAHPIVAEGISMAMQSAWLLCQRLLECRDGIANQAVVDAVGHAYARDWKDAFAARIRAAAMLARIVMQPGAAWALPVIKRFPQVLTWGARLSGKTTQIVRPGDTARHAANVR